MRHECYFCHTKTIEKLIAKFQPDDNTAGEFVFDINNLLSENRYMGNPYLSAQIHRLAKRKLGNNDLYKVEKQRANKTLLSGYQKWRSLVNHHNHPLHLAAKLAVIGNIIDYGAHSVPDDIEKHVELLLEKELKIDESKELFEKINNAKSILYLGDNAGEIVFDKLFIEAINHSNLTYAVRGKPVINDVTLEDVKQTRISDLCNIITNGHDAPSTLIELCSTEFRDAFDNADLIISKGQGNFEGLMNNEDKNIFFLLMAKCKLMAEMVGVSQGDMVITNIKQ